MELLAPDIPLRKCGFQIIRVGTDSFFLQGQVSITWLEVDRNTRRYLRHTFLSLAVQPVVQNAIYSIQQIDSRKALARSPGRGLHLLQERRTLHKPENLYPTAEKSLQERDHQLIRSTMTVGLI